MTFKCVYTEKSSQVFALVLNVTGIRFVLDLYDSFNILHDLYSIDF